MRPILVVQHQPTCPPGWVGEWLTECGATLDVRHPYAADGSGLATGLPDTLGQHAGLLVLGGSMGAHDEATVPWLATVKNLIRAAAAQGRPVLGICLGHQLAAAALGGRVAPNPRGQTVGPQRVSWTGAADDDELVGTLAAHGASALAVQWNNDVVIESPAGTVPLAVNVPGELLAARFAPTVWGVQWHPEAGADLVGPWADKDRAGAAARGVDLDAVLGEIRAAEPQLRHTWAPLAARFAALAAR